MTANHASASSAGSEPTARAAVPRVAPELAAAVARWGLGEPIAASGIEMRGEAFLFTDNDPYVIVDLGRTHRSGWYRLEAEIESDVNLRPRAHLGVGRDLLRDTDFGLKRGANGRYTSFFRAPAAFDRLRFDPSDFRFEAVIRGLRLRKVARRELVEAGIKAAWTNGRRGPRALLRFLTAAAVSVARPSRFESFDTVGASREATDDRAARYARWVAIDEWRIARFLADFERRPVRAGPGTSLAVLAVLRAGEDLAERAQALARSLGAQAVPQWTAEIVLPGLDAVDLPRLALDDPFLDDPRITLRAAPADGVEAGALLAGLDAGGSDWLVVLREDVRLAPHAFAWLVETARRRPNAALVHADDDDIAPDGRRTAGRFRPAWSEALFHARDDLGPLVAIRRADLRRVGGFAGERSDAPLTSLVLELARSPGAIAHVPEILAHRSSGEAASWCAEPVEARAAAVRMALARAGAAGATVEVLPDRATLRVRHPVPDPAPLVSIVIPTKDRPDLLATCVDSILAKSTYRNFEILIVDNNSTERETFAWFERLPKTPRFRVLPYPRPFNYSAINNFAARQARGDILVLLNNDTEVKSPDWLDELVGWVSRPEVGAVGAKLYFPDGTIQHGGVACLSRRGVAGHLHLHDDGDARGYGDRLILPQDLTAVTAACLAIRASVYRAVGGLEERRLAVAFNDVDLCLRIRRAGYRVVWTPHAELFHYESVSRGSDMEPAKKARFAGEVDYMAETWGRELESDPFYSPHFERTNANFLLNLG